MFDIGWGELLVIGVVALLVVGPKELPALLRTLGQGMTKLRRMASEFQGQFQEAMREAEISELKKEADKLAESAISMNPLTQVEKIGDDLQKALDTPSTTAPGEGAGQMPPIAAVAPVVPPEFEQPVPEPILPPPPEPAPVVLPEPPAKAEQPSAPPRTVDGNRA
jgi:sec-independent protein translocase protein TatB